MGPNVKKHFRKTVEHLSVVVFALICFGPCPAALSAQPAPPDVCPRPSPRSVVPEPQDLRSQKGTLEIDLTVRNATQPDGSVRYCYLYKDGSQSPTLRLHPGDLLVLNLKNDMEDPDRAAAASDHGHGQSNPRENAGMDSDACATSSMTMTPATTNLHFHGLTIPPVCHQDDVLKTSIGPGSAPFQYKFRIPDNEPPGLYWYHPHIHGFTKAQVLGGASGALIVEGLERADSAVAGLPERVFVIRDQDLLNPNAPAAASEPVIPRMLIDHDGDAVNTGTGFGKPAKDLSINFVPVPYPDYPPAAIEMKPAERQLWRVLNASAITYLNLEVVFNRELQPLGLVALDGVPMNTNGAARDYVNWQTHIGLPPGARAEFILAGPPAGVQGLLVTRSLDTGPGGENDPNRAIATITASANAPEPRSTLDRSPQPLPPPSLPWLGNVAPARVRKLYFSEKLADPNDPNSPTIFYLTVDGQTPAPFDPHSTIPNIVAKQGEVEDWIIENRSNELHAFHIHQVHFMLLDYVGRPVNEPFLRDTVNVPYYNGRALQYPSVRIRVDFRDPNSIGTFVYHCHLLEHEDGGMMGLIRVDPADPPGDPRTNTSHAGDAPSAAAKN